MNEPVDPSPASRGAPPPVSIVIPTAERPHVLLECAASLRRQQVPEAVELVVVDAGTAAPVDAEALRRAWPNSRRIAYPRKNAAAQRNEGIRQAAGEILCFLDDDCLLAQLA